MSDSKTIKVLFIAGWGRSGTTILGNILGQIPGFTAVGELRFFWERNLAGDHPCGCGLKVDQCPFWSSVIERAWGGVPPNPADMIRWRDRLRTRHLPLLLSPGAADRYSKELEQYRDHLACLYRAIHEVSQSRVIVDSSKFPSYAYALSLLPDIELSVLLMVRDPRAVAYSWLHPKGERGAESSRMKRIGTFSSSFLWLTWNLFGERLGRRRSDRFSILRYEDFAREPRPALEKILSWLDEPNDLAQFQDDHTVTLATTHTSSGNPNRHQGGVVHIQSDDRWQQNLPWWRKLLTAIVCCPLMFRHGYLGGHRKVHG